MTRRNAPRLIDPVNDTMGRTDDRLGIVAPRDLLTRIDALERIIGTLNREVTHLRQMVTTSNISADVQMVGGDVMLTQYAKMIAVEENPNPGLTIGTAAGTGGSAGVSFARGGSDLAGQIRIVTGTSGLSTGTLVTFTFNRAKPNTNYLVLFAPASSAARAVNIRPSTFTTTTFLFVADAAPTSGQQIDISYLVVDVPAT